MVTTNKKSAPKKEPQFTKIMNGANGYLAYDNWKKKYVYHVTKDPVSAVAGVLANGWGSAGAGFGPQTGGPSGKLWLYGKICYI